MPGLFACDVVQHCNKRGDLTPATEMDQVAAVATELCLHNRCPHRTRTMIYDQPRGIQSRLTIGNEGSDRQKRVLSLAPAALSPDLPTSCFLQWSRRHSVNLPKCGSGDPPGRVAWGSMERNRSPIAGGFAVMLCVVVGAFWGLRQGWGSAGMLIGLGVGLVIALIVWMLDRRR